MQQFAPRSGPGHTPNYSTRPQKIIITAITLFAVAGLLVGFTTGAIAHTMMHKQAKDTTTRPTAIPVTPMPTPMPTLAEIIDMRGVGCPLLKLSNSTPKPDETDSISAQILDAKNVKEDGACDPYHIPANPLTGEPNLTCKVWLSKQQDAIGKLNGPIYTRGTPLANPSVAYQQAFPDEEKNAFTNLTQVQDCSQNGTVTWNFKLSPQLQPGDYFIAVTVDWDGIRYRSFNLPITIAPPDGGKTNPPNQPTPPNGGPHA